MGSARVRENRLDAVHHLACKIMELIGDSRHGDSGAKGGKLKRSGGSD
jgi:hypothetical protein